MSPPTPDVAQLAGLLRREPAICTSCAATKLVLSLGRVLAALTELRRTVPVQAGLARCPLCEETQWVLSMVK